VQESEEQEGEGSVLYELVGSLSVLLFLVFLAALPISAIFASKAEERRIKTSVFNINSGTMINSIKINNSITGFTPSSPPQKIPVECQNCGAKTFYTTGTESRCEYCNSPLP
jgi:hypothetical protein